MPKPHPFQQEYKPTVAHNFEDPDTLFGVHGAPSDSALDLILKRRNIFVESHIEANQWRVADVHVAAADELIATHDLVASPIKKQPARAREKGTKSRMVTLRNTENADISFLYSPTSGSHTYFHSTN